MACCSQGLLTRPDWQQASKLPIAHIPCGSGNGVATTCGILDPATAAYAICKARAEPLDVVAVVQGSSRWAAARGVAGMYVMLAAACVLLSNTPASIAWCARVRSTDSKPCTA